MSNTKTVMSQAANTLVKPPVNVEDVFSTYLYDGTGAAQTITNGIDLDGEGGLVWAKARNANSYHSLWDTERGTNRAIFSHLTNAESNYGSNTLTAFNSNGFSLGSSGIINDSAENYASWTFRKAPKFFDVVTFNNDGNAQTISHNLGSVPGMIIMKRTDAANNWAVYHRSSGGPDKYLYLNTTAGAESNTRFWDNTNPTSTEFTIGNINQAGTYVAYLFAHNDGDGGFGPDGDQDIIKCGSYTSSNPSNRPEVDLGFEPQWLLIKNATASSNWMLVDNMRGLPVNSQDQTLAADSSAAENGVIGSPNAVALTPTGFNLTAGVTASNAGTGNTHIYIAIRRGTKVPESATEVFAIDDTPVNATTSTAVFSSGFPVDLGINKRRDGGTNGDTYLGTRLLGSTYLVASNTDAETANGVFKASGYQDGFGYYNGSGLSAVGWQWKRAPKFFDVVAYSGDEVAGRTVSHNLGVAPEMMWVKKRNGTANWFVYNKDLGNNANLKLNLTNASATSTAFWNDTTPTESVFTLGNSTNVNGTGDTYIAYLFASLPGISKVGSYTGTGATLNIDCGFTSGARFVLIKRTNAANNWTLFDSARGIAVGNDPYLYLNNTDAEVNAADFINPYPQGFSLTGVSTLTNELGDSYIFYAIA